MIEFNSTAAIRTTLLCLAIGLQACASVTSNDGQRVVIEYSPGTPADMVSELASKACKEAGKAGAALVIDVSRAPGDPGNALANRLATFRCE